ncbi:MAG: type II secretion system F family protein [Armatimonadetes bacterium]|nr:type II secretion system F family protein [Armatimonadota bacterium]
MPKYRFEARQADSRVRGTIEAPSRVGAYHKLCVRYPRVISLENTSWLWRLHRPGVTRTDLALWVRQLATLLSAGVGMRRSLELGAFGESVPLGKILYQVNEDVTGGMPLSAALSKHPRVFDYQEVTLIRAGEISGKLPAVLARMADDMERRLKLEQRLLAAMVYPLAVLIFASFLFWGFLTFVVPAMAAVFAGFKLELPLLTRVLVFLSNAVRSPWISGTFLVLLALTALTARRWVLRMSERLRPTLFKLSRRLPWIGPVLDRLESSRLLQAFGSLLDAGIRLNQILLVLQQLVSDPRRYAALETVRAGVMEGKSLALVCAQTRLFAPAVTHMLMAGEEAGELAQMMKRSAAMQEMEIEHGTRTLAAMAEPFTLLVLGGVAALAVLAAFLPLVQLMQAFISEL